MQGAGSLGPGYASMASRRASARPTRAPEDNRAGGIVEASVRGHFPETTFVSRRTEDGIWAGFSRLFVVPQQRRDTRRLKSTKAPSGPDHEEYGVPADFLIESGPAALERQPDPFRLPLYRGLAKCAVRFEHRRSRQPRHRQEADWEYGQTTARHEAREHRPAHRAEPSRTTECAIPHR